MKSILIKNKRGDAASLIIGLVVMLFVIAVFALIGGKVISTITAQLKLDPTFSSNNNTMNTLNMVETKSPGWLDYFFVFVIFSTIIGLIISSIYTQAHPAMMIIFIILLVLAIIFAGIFVNAYTLIGENDAVSATYNQLTMTKAIMGQLPLILFITGLIVIIILYGKGRNSGGFPQ